jgi:hypothetical protein
MKSLFFVLLASVLCAGQGQIVGGVSTQGGWSMPISNNLAAITLTPPSATAVQGQSVQFSALGTYQLGNTADVTTFGSWSVSNGIIASVGVQTTVQFITCSGVGTLTVTLTIGTVTGTAALNCQSPPATGADNINCNVDGTWKGATTDGPANLPTACYYTALSGTPSPGVVWPAVSTNTGLTNTFQQAHCGDVIPVTAGSTITGTVFLGPVKGCDDQHYITIKSTGVSDPSFPAEGTRLTPCQSGIASLPNRPSYPCTTPSVLTAKLVANGVGNGSALVISGEDHIRIIGIEFTRVTTPHVSIGNLIDLGSTAVAAPFTNHIIFDRNWFHGVNADGQFPQTNANDTSTTRAIYLAQSNHVAVLDSYFSDFYDNGSGTISGVSYGSSNGNTDAQCIAGGIGSVANSGWGVYKLVNNHCEASGEALLFGGDVGPALTPNGCTILVNCNVDAPSDLEIRRNYFFKPLSWNGNTTTVNTIGWPVVKNGFEMKTGVRALFEANLIENCWYSSQGCNTFSVAPVNQQSGQGTPMCPTCVITDFTYRYNYGYNATNGIAVYAFIPAGCPTCNSQGANRVSIHDDLIGDNMNKGSVTGLSTGDALDTTAVTDATNSGLNKLQNVKISHVSFVGALRAFLLLGDATGTTKQYVNFTVQNNVMAFGSNSGWVNPGTAGGCAQSNQSSLFNALNACASSYTWDHNAIFNVAGTLGANWPTNGSGLGNWFFPGPGTVTYKDNTGATQTGSIGFTNYGSGDSLINPGNYAITNAAPIHNAATDGTNLGADISTLITKIDNVRDSPSQQFTTGNLKIYPASTTAELGTTIPFSAENSVNGVIDHNCTWSVQSGGGSINANGWYTAPNAVTSAVIQCIDGSNLQTANVTVNGTVPTAAGDCATVPYAHSGATENLCTMTHPETVGSDTRTWKVVIPANYVAGQSGLVVSIEDSHGLTSTDSCGIPTSEIMGVGPYLQTVPSPAPVLVCTQAVFDSALANTKYNWLGRNSITWTGAVIPDDNDYVRQLILITVRDLQLNPKAVYITNDFDAQGYETPTVTQVAAANSDLVAAIGVGNESSFNNMDSTFTVVQTQAPNLGQKLNAPANPVSMITLTGQAFFQTGVGAYICGLSPTTFPTSNKNYHILTVDDTFRYWNQTDQATTTTLLPNGAGSSFCTGTYDGSGNGIASTLEVRKDTGGKDGTALYAYKIILRRSTPYCSYNYTGGDTLGCNNPSVLSTPVIDFRLTSPCNTTSPCNHFLDAGTGAASASGYSTVDMYWKFFKNHPKP